jgi:dTDP-4-amino-4,6-dideoxygalactose transaminase
MTAKNFFIKLSSSLIGKEEIKSVTQVLKSNYLGMGPVVKKFEDQLEKFLQNKVACVSSGTSAIHMALQALNLKKGDEVLVPSLTFVATYQAISASGAHPISCDINLEDCTIDLKDALNKITKRTKVILPVHYSGYPGNILSIYEFAKKNRLRVVEDAAHAFGSYFNKKKIGSIGDIICFSFDGIKNITCGEGGCVVSSDKKIIETVKNIRFLGIIKESEKRYVKKKSFNIDVKSQGWRYHMSDINASIGLAQLKKLDFFKKKRIFLINKYKRFLKDNSNIVFFKYDYKNIFPHIFVIKLKKIINFEKVKNILLKKNIEIGFHWKPAHTLSFYNEGAKLPNTEYIAKRMLTLPLHVGLTEKHIKYICKELNKLI